MTSSRARDAGQALIWSARSLGAGGRQLLREIILPGALPQIMTGLQVALPIAMIVTIVTEMLMAGQGLGGAMIAASHFAGSPGVFAGIVEIAVAGLCLINADRAAPAPVDLAPGGAGTDDGLTRENRPE